MPKLSSLSNVSARNDKFSTSGGILQSLRYSGKLPFTSQFSRYNCEAFFLPSIVFPTPSIKGRVDEIQYW